MKLAEALILRADAQERLGQLKDRLTNSARVQEGDKPPEEPAALLKEVESVSNELLSLNQRIAKTDTSTHLEDGTLLSDALAAREVLTLRRSLYSHLVSAASAANNRHTNSEIKYVSTVNVSQIQRALDKVSLQLRELDIKIQQANWNFDLVD